MCCAMEYLHRKLIIDSQVAADRKTKKKKTKKQNKPIMAFKDGRGGDQPTKWFLPSLISTQKYIYIYKPSETVCLFVSFSSENYAAHEKSH